MVSTPNAQDGFFEKIEMETEDTRLYKHLSGLLHRYNISIESSISLIQKLSINDEERDSRLSVLHTTYQKNSNEVSGYQYLISVLENIVINN